MMDQLFQILGLLARLVTGGAVVWLNRGIKMP
jgi:hypothetical protein